MSLHFRIAEATDYQNVEDMVIESFEPITWHKNLDTRFGLLNGTDWRTRWKSRIQAIFERQIVLLGENGGELAAMSSGTLDTGAALGYIDILAVDRRWHGCGYGREMLSGMMRHLRRLGGQYVYLDCLTDNDVANALYQAAGFEEVARQVRWFRQLPEEVSPGQ